MLAIKFRLRGFSGNHRADASGPGLSQTLRGRYSVSAETDIFSRPQLSAQRLMH